MDGAAPWERCPDSLLKSLGMHRMGQWPRTHASREQWRSLISLVLRLRVSKKISSQPVVSALLLSLFTIPLRSHDLHTEATEEG